MPRVGASGERRTHSDRHIKPAFQDQFKLHSNALCVQNKVYATPRWAVPGMLLPLVPFAVDFTAPSLSPKLPTQMFLHTTLR